MRFKALSNKGKKRSANEDNFFIDKKLNFFMVADGMGGHAAGEVASQTAADVAAAYDFDLDFPLESLSQLTYNINQEIIKESQLTPEYRGMGTTFAAVIVKEKNLYYVNLGDSRIYLYSKNEKKLRKISKDHSLVAELLRKGKINKEEAFNHPKKNIVTQALGLEDDLDLDKGQFELNEDIYLLLCTDGLTDMIKENEIEEVFKNNEQPEKISEILLDKAMSSGGLDNITLIVVDYNE